MSECLTSSQNAAHQAHGHNTHLPSRLFTGRFLVWETWSASAISVESQWLKEKTSFNLVPTGNQTDKLLTGFYRCNSRIDNDVIKEKFQRTSFLHYLWFNLILIITRLNLHEIMTWMLCNSLLLLIAQDQRHLKNKEQRVTTLTALVFSC